MAFNVNSFCDLCCQPVRKGRRTRNIKFPGCYGLPPVLNEHLAVYFLMKKLLDLKDEQFLELMTGDGGSVGRDKLNCFCEKCEDVIIEAFELHLKVVDLQRKIKKLGNRLKELLKLSWKGNENVRSSFKGKEIVGKIRKFMCNEDLTDKTNVKTDEVNPVKAELNDEEQEDFQEEDSFMDSFSNAQSDAENSSVLPDPESGEEEESVSSKGRRKRVDPSDDEGEYNAAVNDDSDYNPGEDAAQTTSIKLRRQSKRKSGKYKKGSSSRYHGTSSVGNTCHICGMFQKTAHGFRGHMGVHEESTTKYGNKYDCPKCKYPTISEFKLRYHMTKAHQVTHNNTCSVCGFVGSRRHVYDKHMLEKHGIQLWTPIDDPKEEKTEVPKPPSFAKVCNICGMLHKSPNGFRNHMSVHKESTEMYGNKYDCSKCKYPTISECKLRYHMTKAHQVTNSNICSICDYVGSRRSLYEKHMLNKHGIQAWTSIDEPKDETTLRSLSLATDESKGILPRGDRSLMLQCEHCTAFYKTTEAFERHRNTHKLSSELNNKFDCDLCGFPTISERLLENHKRRVHQNRSMHTCSICSHKVRRHSQLKMHMRKYHKHVHVDASRKYRKWSENKRKDGRYQCKLCSYLYKESGSLKRHMQEHEKSNQLGDKWECQRCKFPCTSEERLRRHTTTIHEGISPSTCSVCQKTFCRPNLLKVHMIVHQKHDQAFDVTTGRFSCNLCDFKVKTLRGLEGHVAGVHRFANVSRDAWKLSHDPYICSQCGRSFLNTNTLRRHVRKIHEGKYTNRYRCKVCGKGFEAKCYLKRHMKVHDPDREKEFVCEICGAAYTDKQTLNKHIDKFHSGPESSSNTQKTLNCKFCHEKYLYKHLLGNHLRHAHKDVFTFKCDLCDKSYISGSSLRLHKEIHHSEGAGAGTHACEYCEKQFPHKHNVLNHYKYCAEKKKLKYNSKSK